MGIKDRLRRDLKIALKERRDVEKDTLRLVLDAVKYAEIEKQAELTDDEIVRLLRRELKKREEALEMFRQGGRDDLVEKTIKEMEVIKKYMPEEMSEAEIRALAERKIRELGATSPKDAGRVIGAIMREVKGKADGSKVSQIVRQMLSEAEGGE